MKILLRNINFILKSRYKFGQKIQLFLAYIKIRWYRLSKSKSKCIRLLGFRVNFVNVNELHSLFEDIFLKEVYYFKSNRDNPNIVDGGANIGISILYFKYIYPKSKILAFEPLKSNYEILYKNIEDNNLSGIEVHEEGLGKHEQDITLYGSRHVATISKDLIKEHQNEKHSYTEENVVHVTTLSKFISDESNISLLKLDIEGAELQVVKDLSSNSKLNKVQGISMEFHHHHNVPENKLSELIEILEDNNYNFGFDTHYNSFDKVSVNRYYNFMLYAKNN